MAGFANDANNKDIMFCDNLDFTGATIPTGNFTTDGQIPIGSSIAPNIRIGLIGSSDGSIIWTVGHGTLTAQVAGGTSSLKTLTGNSGGAISPTAGNINVITANATVKIVGSGSTLTQDFNLSNLVLGSSLPSISGATLNVGMGTGNMAAVTSATRCVGIGAGSLISLTSGQNNVGVGANALASIVSHGSNVAVGTNALQSCAAGDSNTAIGDNSQQTVTGSNNSSLGYTALLHLTSGSNNLCLGNAAGNNYTGTESSNICLMAGGTLGESNVMRLGTQGSSSGQVNQTYLAGVLNMLSGLVMPVTTPGAYPYTTLITDQFIKVDTSSARTIIPLASPVTGTKFIIKDTVGSAAANNITITPSGKNIDGAASYVINSNYGSITIVYGGSEWSVI